MKVFSWEDFQQKDIQLLDFFKIGSALTIGTFDGPHMGHEKLFNTVLNFKKNEAQEIKTGVVTFVHPPQSNMNEKDFAGEVTTLKLKLAFLEDKGFDFVLLIDFSSDFSKIKGKDFLLQLKEICSMQFLSVGLDFRCGYNLDTGVAELSVFCSQHGVQFSVIEELLFNGKRISSSSIRQCVLAGNMHDAECQLGRPYCIDCSGIKWHTSKINSGCIEAARSSFHQVLPPQGEYRIMVECAELNCKASISTNLTAEFNFLRLEIPPEYYNQQIKIIFI